MFDSPEHHRIPPSKFVSVDNDSRFYSSLMQNDDLPEPLRPLMMHVKGCLNLRSSHISDLSVTHKPLLNISELNGRIVTETSPLKKRDIISLVFGLCDDMYLTVLPLTLNLALGMHCYCFRVFPFDVWEAL